MTILRVMVEANMVESLKDHIKCDNTRSSGRYMLLLLAPAEGLWPLAT